MNETLLAAFIVMAMSLIPTTFENEADTYKFEIECGKETKDQKFTVAVNGKIIYKDTKKRNPCDVIKKAFKK